MANNVERPLLLDALPARRPEKVAREEIRSDAEADRGLFYVLGVPDEARTLGKQESCAARRHGQRRDVFHTVGHDAER
jgi:hypothetical protein